MTQGEHATWRVPFDSLGARVRMVMAIEIVPFALACAGVYVVGVTSLGVLLFVVMYVLTMLGVDLGMHRMLAHRQFAAKPWLRATLCVLGAMAGQGSPLLWSAVHRVHHSDPDGVNDIHSPSHGRRGVLSRVAGFLWAQSLWYTEVPGITRFRRVLGEGGQAEPRASNALNAPDRQARTLVHLVQDWRRDDLVVRLDVLYPLWIGLGLALPTALGGIAAGPHGALAGLVWGGLVRFVAVQKVSFAVNSLGHTVGTQRFQTGDDSRNNVVMALLTLGAGWHNNHHAFPGAASLWLSPWQVDISYALIRVLEAMGAVDDVRRVDRATVEARRAR